MIFCTLFNKAYLPQGVTLYRSLARTLGDDFLLYVLCMDEFSAAALARLKLSRLRIISLPDLEDETLRSARANRTFGEYCWTCTTPLMLYVLARQPEGTVVSYVDADIRFFSNPRAILEELGENSIFIHEHDFAPEHAHFLAVAGRFNVGVVAIRNVAEGRECLERWKSQCVADCRMDPAAGRCGDQNYLDEWPELYPGLVVSKNPGIGLGPWNIGKHRLTRHGVELLVDGRPVVFYHYHSLRIWRPRFRLRPILMVGGGYLLAPDVVNAIYRPYARDLWSDVSALEQNGSSILSDLAPMTLRGIFRHRLYRNQLDVSVGALPVAAG